MLHLVLDAKCAHLDKWSIKHWLLDLSIVFMQYSHWSLIAPNEFVVNSRTSMGLFVPDVNIVPRSL